MVTKDRIEQLRCLKYIYSDCYFGDSLLYYLNPFDSFIADYLKFGYLCKA